MLRPSAICKFLGEVENAELKEFMEWYFHEDSIRLKPPQDNILLLDGGTMVVLYREGQFQVEMVTGPPNFQIPEHTHDDVDSYEVCLSGSLELYANGIQAGFIRTPRSDGISRSFAQFVPISSSCVHGGRAGPEGACFLSIQRWRDGVKPTHVALNWNGKSFGDQHKKALNA